MSHFTFWMRWSWRDLRARWVQVLVISLIIALGTAVFAGMGGQKVWRTDSYNRSYERLHMYDLRVELASGGYVDQTQLADALAQVEGVARFETRLLSPTLVDASTEDETILVRGRLIGVDVSNNGPYINSVYVGADDGRTLQASDAGQMVAVVEYKFADHYDLQPGSALRISGDVALDFIGRGHSPEYFMIMPGTGEYFAQGNFAAIFVPLETAQALTERPGLVNDAVLLLDEDADPAQVKLALEDTLAEQFPATGVTITTKDDDPVYTMLYNDAEGDQQLWDTVALLFLLGAAMGAFNLAGRMVEAQRREIGVNMALGTPRRWIAFRPMLVGLQIAVLGTLLGVLLGLGLNQLFAQVVKSFAPLPYYDIHFYIPGYVRATLFGVLLPFIATLIPVWRAVRVPPIDAIQTGYMVAKGGGLSGLANRLPLPGRSFTHMPVKNVLRSPWRSVLTVCGIGIAVALLVFIVGALDTYIETMERADHAFRHAGKDRVLVNLNFFYPIENGEVSALQNLTQPDGSPLFAQTEPALLLGGTLLHNGEEIDTLLELHDMNTAIWTPELTAGRLNGNQTGLIISQKAADDLGVGVGDTITLEHPERTGANTFRLVQTDVTVGGMHDNPLRPLSYMDLSAATLMGLEKTANQLVMDPAPGVTEDDVKLALLTQPGVASVEPVADFSEGVRELLKLATGMLAVMSGVVLIMSFLIAFNTTSISVDERVREIATMFAFGLQIRTVTRMQMIENVVMGTFATLLGIAAGWVGLLAIFNMDSPELEDMTFLVTLYPRTVLLAVLMGVIVAALTPVLSIRRMKRMDIPSTLRVME